MKGNWREERLIMTVLVGHHTPFVNFNHSSHFNYYARAEIVMPRGPPAARRTDRGLSPTQVITFAKVPLHKEPRRATTPASPISFLLSHRRFIVGSDPRNKAVADGAHRYCAEGQAR